MGALEQGSYSKGISESIKNEFLKELESFEREIFKSDSPEKDFTKFSKIMNSFLQKEFNLHYKFTYEDLKFEAKELKLPKEVEQSIETICDKMNEMEFDKTKVSKEKLLDVATEVENLIDLLSGSLVNDPVVTKKIEEEEAELEEEEALEEKEEALEEKKIRQIKDEEEMFALQEKTLQEGKKIGFFSKIFRRKPAKAKEELPELAEFPVAEEKKKKSKSAVENEDLKETNSVQDAEEDVKEPKAIDDEKVTSEAIVEEEDLKQEPVLKEEKEVAVELAPPVKVVEKSISDPLFEVDSKPKKIKKSKVKQIKKLKQVKVKQIKKHKSIKKIKQIKHKEKKAIHKKVASSKLKAISKKEKHIERELPKFEMQHIQKKKSIFEKNLAEIVNSLETGRKNLKQEMKLVEDEKKVILDERKTLKNLKEERYLPEFKIMDTKLAAELKELNSKKQELKEKEKEIEERLKAVTVMEKHLGELSKKLKNDEKGMKEKESFVASKEKLIKKIKAELSKKYDMAMKEIDTIRKDLKEKENNFKKLQAFYKSRENKLALEESNLLDEKRRYSKIVSGLLGKHLAVARQDLEHTEARLKELKDYEKELDNKLKESKEKFELLIEDKDNLKKEISEKKKYFDTLEKEFASKDPAFEKLSLELKERDKILSEREPKMHIFELALNKAEEEAKSKKRSIELRELDIMALEKEIEKLITDLKNRDLRLTMLEKHINRRIESYDALEKDIRKSMANERRAITRIENKLQKRGYNVSRKLKETETEVNVYNNYQEELKKANLLKDDEELHVQEIRVKHEMPTGDIGDPSILDILRLLNMAKDFIRKGETSRSREAYLEIQKLFDDLDESGREEIYNEIVNVFKPRADNLSMPPATFDNNIFGENIDGLLKKFEFSVENGDIKSSEEIYGILQQKYTELPKEQKNMYYSRIMDLYNKVLAQQVTTGVVS